MTIKMFQCHFCNKYFPRKFNLYRHLTKVHDVKESDIKVNLYDSLQFGSFSEFLQWKETIESETLSSYVKERGDVPRDDIVYAYYICCRSGTYELKEKRKRKVKSQQSKKVGYVCPARMHLTISKSGIAVKFFKDHNHSHDVQHLALPKRLRASIAEKLKGGVSAKEILADIRNSADAVGKSHLINNKDILNIKRDFQIGKEAQQHEEHILPSSPTEHLRPSSSTETLRSTIQSMIEIIFELNSGVTLEDNEYDQVQKSLELVISTFTNNSSEEIHSTKKIKFEKREPFPTRKKGKEVKDYSRAPKIVESFSLKKNGQSDCEVKNVHTEFDHIYCMVPTQSLPCVNGKT